MTTLTLSGGIIPPRTDGGPEPALSEVEIWEWWRLTSLGALDDSMSPDKQMDLARRRVTLIHGSSAQRAEVRGWLTAAAPTELEVWEKLAEHGEDFVRAWIELLPAAQRPRARALAYAVGARFRTLAGELEDECYRISAAVVGNTDEPASAMKARFEAATADHRHKRLLRAMISDEPVKGTIWQMVRPQ